MTSGEPKRCCDAVRSAILATAWLLVFLYIVTFWSLKLKHKTSSVFTEH